MYPQVRSLSHAGQEKSSYFPDSSPWERPRLLIASSNPDMPAHLSNILDGMVQVIACSSPEALEAVSKSQNLGVVVLDLQMDGTQGLLQEAGLGHELVSRDIPFLLIASSAGAEYEARILEDNIDDIISYPFIPSVVRAQIKSRLALKQSKRSREQRLMNLYRALSCMNEAIMRLRGEKELFQVFCDIAVEYGNMQLAWVGIPDNQHKLVHVASKGGAIGYLDNLLVSTNPDLPEGRGLSGIAYRENRPAVTNDISTDASMRPWLTKNQEYGIASIAAYPISRGGNPYAILAVYSAQIGAFDDEIVRLLGEIAGNISFALDNLDREAARQASENRFRVIAEESPFPMMIHAEDGQIIMANHIWTDITGYSTEEIPSISTWIKKVYGKNQPIVQADIKYLYGITERIDEGEYIILCKDGSIRTWHFSSSPIGRLSDGRRAVISMAMDVTVRKVTEDKLKLAATVFRDSSEAMMITDAGNHIISVNQAFEELTGYAQEEVIGKTPSILKSGRHDRSFYEAMWQQIDSTHHWQGDIWNRKKNGELYAARLVINATRQDNVPSTYVGHCHRTSGKLALMFLDLDGFKKVNDSLGHNMGDLLLKKVALRLESCIRDTDIAARLGGDEFTVILTEIHHPINVERIAQNILRTLAEPYELINETANVSASIGIAFYPIDGLDVEELIRNADQAMYIAKQAGKNRYHYCNT
jgi:diguanylate cyclase (GGDEF)-like protein/PAS domain S-box-containing protein